MAEIIIETDRLVLRREMPGDVDAWLDHLNSPRCTEHLGGPKTREQIVERTEKMKSSWEAHGLSFLFVGLKPSLKFLGVAGLAPIQNEHAPEALQDAIQIGWHLREDHWGQGYGFEAARAVMDFAFARPQMDIVYAQTAMANMPSWRLMEKLGMRRRADLDYDDPAYPPEENPTIIYAICRDEWRTLSGEAIDAA